MAKEITGYVKLQIKGGQANPAPPVGPALGQRGINIMEFCKAFNEKTKSFMGKPVPVVITVYKDKKFDFIIKTPPASFKSMVHVHVFGMIGVASGPIGQSTAEKFELEVAASVPGGPGAYFGSRKIMFPLACFCRPCFDMLGETLRYLFCFLNLTKYVFRFLNL